MPQTYENLGTEKWFNELKPESLVEMKPAKNCSAWALGRHTKQGFFVRRVVWGLLLAQYEKRDDEEIRATTILVERVFKRRRDVRN